MPGKPPFLLTSVFEMGLDQEMEPVYEAVSRIILEDTRIFCSGRGIVTPADAERASGALPGKSSILNG